MPSGTRHRPKTPTEFDADLAKRYGRDPKTLARRRQQFVGMRQMFEAFVPDSHLSLPDYYRRVRDTAALIDGAEVMNVGWSANGIPLMAVSYGTPRFPGDEDSSVAVVHPNELVGAKYLLADMDRCVVDPGWRRQGRRNVLAALDVDGYVLQNWPTRRMSQKPLNAMVQYAIGFERPWKNPFEFSFWREESNGFVQIGTQVDRSLEGMLAGPGDGVRADWAIVREGNEDVGWMPHETHALGQFFSVFSGRRTHTSRHGLGLSLGPMIRMRPDVSLMDAELELLAHVAGMPLRELEPEEPWDEQSRPGIFPFKTYDDWKKYWDRVRAETGTTTQETFTDNRYTHAVDELRKHSPGTAFVTCDHPLFLARDVSGMPQGLTRREALEMGIARLQAIEAPIVERFGSIDDASAFFGRAAERMDPSDRYPVGRLFVSTAGQIHLPRMFVRAALAALKMDRHIDEPASESFVFSWLYEKAFYGTLSLGMSRRCFQELPAPESEPEFQRTLLKTITSQYQRTCNDLDIVLVDPVDQLLMEWGTTELVRESLGKQHATADFALPFG